ncbi:MAG: ATP-binding cassette domain-containing protein, partial [Dehalococcoidia bacterium]
MPAEPSDPSSAAAAVISARGLVKRYGSLVALDGVSFEVQRGEIFGILGPNGAGKTTLVEILEGLTEPTAGTASVLGIEVTERPVEVKRRIGVQLQASTYHRYLTLREILELFGSFYPRAADPVDL